MGGSEISVRPGNWAPSEPALPHARKSKKPVLEWPFRGGTDSSNLLSSSGESGANSTPRLRQPASCEPRVRTADSRIGTPPCATRPNVSGGEGGATRLPLLNEPAPAFHARTTQGERGLEDYRGRWLIFFAHPADFTPVCASEFIAFSKAYDRFQELGCDLLGLSVDSLFAHIAWIANIKERFGVEVRTRNQA
jgi:hypothetical protein